MDLTLPYKKTWNKDKKHIDIDIGRENREQHFVRIKLDTLYINTHIYTHIHTHTYTWATVNKI